MVRKSLLIVATMLVLGPAQAMAETVSLRVACFLPARSVSVTRMFEPWIKAIQADSAGAIKADGFWGGSLGRNPRKQFDLAVDGVADVSLVLPGYTPGKFPDFGMFELPYLIRSAQESSIANWRMFEKGLLRGLDRAKVLGFFSTEPNMVHSRKPLKSLADLKGLKIRAAGPVYASTVKHYGGIPIGMPVTQLTESLSRGVVDGTILGWGGALIFRIHNVAKFHYQTPLGTTPAMVVMNKKKWNGLPASAKATLTKFSAEWIANAGGKGFDDFSRRAEGIIMKQKVKRSVVKASPADIARQLAEAKPIHDQWIARTKDGALKYRTLVGILEDIRAGR